MALPFRSGTTFRGASREEATIFRKTKMCKFHILGACRRSSSCAFAHSIEELEAPPDLSFTKICKTLINTGRCEDQNCTYAHSREQLRDNLAFPSLAFRSHSREAACGSHRQHRKPRVMPAGKLCGASNANAVGGREALSTCMPCGESEEQQHSMECFRISMPLTLVSACYGTDQHPSVFLEAVDGAHKEYSAKVANLDPCDNTDNSGERAGSRTNAPSATPPHGAHAVHRQVAARQDLTELEWDHIGSGGRARSHESPKVRAVGLTCSGNKQPEKQIADTESPVQREGLTITTKNTFIQLEVSRPIVKSIRKNSSCPSFF